MSDSVQYAKPRKFRGGGREAFEGNEVQYAYMERIATGDQGLTAVIFGGASYLSSA